ncbi:MAG: DNA primase [Candidatus Eisenbacteria bacterium]|uniref:DNA primase n=1 Tax=Eiseniibacteriota bacterium TaxID=2212470 RepID=A0A538U872_UNCEI|nr:MAG: DNA primase [Candidatus Eisenbacteria bacterium]
MTTRGALRSDDWVERVREASDLVEIVRQTVALKRVGRNWTGLCPFHSEKTPSFTVSPERGLYHCFSCKAGGDVFKFVQETEKVGFLEAVELLSRRAGIPVPERRGERGTLRGQMLEALELAAVGYEQWLRDPGRGAGARAYLASRGLREETVRDFRLGLAPEGWQNLVDRLRTRVSEEVLVQAGLAARREGDRGLYDRFRHRLMIPLIANGGAVVGFAARALGDDPPKYLNSPESAVFRKGSFVFALEQARRALGQSGELVVVEGQFDAIALHQAGVAHVVATSGTALTPEHARTFQRLVPRVALTFDGDAAGRDATMRSVGVLLAAGLEVLIVDLPPGEDPDLLVRSRGREGWNERRAAAYDPVEFVHHHVHRAAMTGGSSPGNARERSLQAVVGLAASVADPVRVKLLLERAAEVFGVPESVLNRGVALRRQGARIESPVREVVRQQELREAGLEHDLLRALLRAPQALDPVRQRLTPEDFRDPTCRELALWMWAGREDEAAPAVEVLARELEMGDPGALDWHATAVGAANRLSMRRLEELQRDRKRRMESATTDEEKTRLMREIYETARELKQLSH